MSDNNNININTPEIGPYTRLQPFRFWCQKVLPLVYDESLSYYELLCKVVDYLNKTMEDVDQMITDMGEFQTAYTEFTTETRDAYIAFSREVSQAVEGLESFVNNYFNNLNVQTEINNKLDAMAEAGYFDNLFNTLFRADIISEAGSVTSTWIAQNLLQETGYVIDKSLTVENAAADAAATGAALDIMNNTLGIEKVVYQDNTYVVTNTDPVDLTQVAASGFSSAIVPCKELDMFSITGRGGGAAAHFAVFTDESGNKLLDIPNYNHRHENVIMIAPHNAKYLVINNNNSYGEGVALKNNYIVGTTYFNDSDFEDGGIDPRNGEDITASRYRSKSYIADNIEKIVSSASGKFGVFAYSNDTYVGTWNGSVFTDPGSVTYITEFDFAKASISSSYEDLKYRIVFQTTYIPEDLTIYCINAYNKEMISLRNDFIRNANEINDLQQEIEDLPIPDIRKISDMFFASDDQISLAASYSDLIDLYDDLVSDYPDYVTKNELTSGDITNYEYVFGTANYNNVPGERSKDSVINKPYVLIVTGIHGNEKSSIMSTYSFLRSLCENKNPISGILQKCILRVIPCACSYGFNNNTRWNENGVNINRNFDASWESSGTPFTNNYSGPSAASEDETKIIQSWIDAYISNAIVLIDYHNSGYENEVSYIGMANSLTGAAKFKNAYRYAIDNTIGYWTLVRELTGEDIIYGYTGQNIIGGSCQKYGTDKDKLSATLESSLNQNNSGRHSDTTIGIGAEILADLLMETMKKFVEE